MRRDLGAYLFLVLIIGALGGMAWLTRHPDSEVVRAAEDLPYLGPLARRFREAYRPPPPPPPAMPEPAEAPPAGSADPVQAPLDLTGYVWVVEGMELKSRPSPEAPTIMRLRSTGQVRKLTRRGAWYEVRYLGHQGWVLLEGYDETGKGPPLGRAPAPPRPLSPREADAETLLAARSLLGDGERQRRLGPYTVYTDCDDDALLAHLDRVVGQLEPAYVERYGRQPLGTPKAVVAIYATEPQYRRLQVRSERIRGLRSAGHSLRGLATLYTGSHTRSEVTATLIHELVHLINRRALGPALPSWIDEGLADDLASSRIDEDGHLVPHELGGRREQISKTEIRWDGPLAALSLLKRRMSQARLPTLDQLLRLEWQDFVRDSSVHYALSAFWVRYLLDAADGRHAAGFRAYLAAVAAGEQPTVELLEDKLGQSLETFDHELRLWLLVEAERAGITSTSRVRVAPVRPAKRLRPQASFAPVCATPRIPPVLLDTSAETLMKMPTVLVRTRNGLPPVAQRRLAITFLLPDALTPIRNYVLGLFSFRIPRRIKPHLQKSNLPVPSGQQNNSKYLMI